MPAEIIKNVLIDGPRHAVVHFTIVSDGSGELVQTKILDSKYDIYPVGQPTQVTITQLWWGQSYFDSALYRYDTVPVLIWAMPVGSDSHVDFRSFGGIKVPVDMEGNGDLLLSTFGFTANTSVGTYVIELKKD
jgi:hypothetical protein